MRTAIVYNFLLEATLMASIAILLMIPIRMTLRRKLGSRALAFGWMLVAIRLLCPLTLPNPVIHTIRSPFAPDEAIRPIAGQIKVRLEDAVMGMYNHTWQTGAEESVFARMLNQLQTSMGNGMLSIWLMRAYLIGAALVLMWFILSNARFRLRLRADRIEPISGEMLEQYQSICRQRGVKPIPVWFVDPLPSACLVGVFRPYIALPLTARPQEAAQVLMHEVCHYRAKDHWWGLIRLLCCVLHWFNPLVWLAAHMSRTDIELACDDRVTDKLDESQKKAYAGVLVLAAARRDLPGLAVLSTGMSMTGRKLKARVSSILSARQTSRAMALAFVLLSSMALVGAFATAEYLPGVKLENMPVNERTVDQREIPHEDEAALIAYAKEIWQNDYVSADVEGYTFGAAYINGHYEVLGQDENGETKLMSAFLPDGRVIYLCNMASGDRDAFSADLLYGADAKVREAIDAFALEALEALVPGQTKQDMRPVSFSSESEPPSMQGTRFFHYLEESDANHVHRRGINIQVTPKIRVTYYIDHQYFTSDDADRLEPGNG